MTNVSDPWVSVGVDDRIYVSALGLRLQGDSVVESQLLVTTSSDRGDSWAPPAPVVASSEPLDNSAVAAAPDTPGLAYVTTTRYGSDRAPALFSRTRDGGATWSAPQALSVLDGEQQADRAPQPLALTRSRVAVLFTARPRGSRIAMVTSTDDGETWTAPVEIAHWTWSIDPQFPGTGVELAVAPDIAHAVSGSDGSRLWVAHPATDSAGRYTVALARSTDAGGHWTDRQLSTPGFHAWRPSLAIAPEGALAITWFRPDGKRRNSGSVPVAVDLATIRAVDDDTPVIRTIDRFEWRPRGNGEFFLGDYHGLAFAPEGPVAIYVRSGAHGARVVVARGASVDARRVGR